MSKPTDVRTIVAQWLRAHGYDGLYDDDSCGCEVSDLMPCEGCTIQTCLPGYKVPCDPETCAGDGDCPWHIDAEKPKKRPPAETGDRPRRG